MEKYFVAVKEFLKEMYAKSPILTVVGCLFAVSVVMTLIDILLGIGGFVLSLIPVVIVVGVIICGVSCLKDKFKK